MAKVNPIRSNAELSNFLEYLKHTNYRNYVMAATSLYSGLRISDVLNLKVKDVKNKRCFEVREDKTGKYYRQEIHPKLKTIYKKYCQDKGSNEYLIKSREGYNRPLSESQAWRIVNKASIYVGITINVGCHSLRKTFAWNLYVLSGRDIELVRKALNHSTAAITKRYIGIEEEDVNMIMRKLSYI